MQGQGKVTRATDKSREIQWEKCEPSRGREGERVYLHFTSQGYYHGVIESLARDANAIEVESEKMYEENGEVWRVTEYETVHISDKRLERAMSDFNSRGTCSRGEGEECKEEEGA